MIRVMIVDDDALVRLGLADLLADEPGMEVVAQAGDGIAAIEKARAHRVDVALVDIRMPRMDGIAAIAELLKLPHPPKVITLTTFDLGSTSTRPSPRVQTGSSSRTPPRARSFERCTSSRRVRRCCIPVRRGR